MNQDQHDRLSTEKQRALERAAEIEQRLEAYRTFAESAGLQIGDHLYPSFTFIRHLMEQVNNSTPRIIVAWLEAGYVLVTDIEMTNAPDATVNIGVPYGGMGLTIPLVLAQSMRKEWLLAPPGLQK